MRLQDARQWPEVSWKNLTCNAQPERRRVVSADQRRVQRLAGVGVRSSFYSIPETAKARVLCT